ncbi:MAG: TRAP transporter small permease subunit [Bacteriovoracaceae bacterium]|nr:TRAP transporter small permease subunit [Bacteriovoracaceae bacterium]
MSKLVFFVDNAIEKISSFLLIVSVLLLVDLSILFIVLRWFNITYIWSDPLIRHIVFITIFLGGVIATGRKSHISIDILGKYLHAKNNQLFVKYLERFIALVSFFGMLWAIKGSYDFTISELQYGKIAFLGIHSGFLTAITPVGFTLISYRFLAIFVRSFYEEENT